MDSKYEIIKNKIDEMVQLGIIPGASFSFINLYNIENYVIGNSKIKPSIEPLRLNMLYDLASVSKVVATTTRIFQLISENKIKLDTYVFEILPKFKIKEITIKDLLLHEGGLISDFDNKHEMSKADLVNSIYELDKVSYKIGSKQCYSDIGYILLGWIIESIDGELDSKMNSSIFNSLDMENTGYNLSRLKENFVPTEITINRGLIQGEVHDHKAYLLNGKSGSAGLFSTLEDLNKFVVMMLSEGSYKGKQILEKKIFTILKENIHYNRTLGWEVLGNTEKNILFHTGFCGTSILLDLDKKEGFILLTNRIHPRRDNTKFIEKRKELFRDFIS